MGSLFSGGSPTGLVPVRIQSEKQHKDIWFDIGLKTGKHLAERVCSEFGLQKDSFYLVFAGKQIENDDSETLLDKGFYASGGPSTVNLVLLKN